MIPVSEFRKGAREWERPTEMALLEEIIPRDKILEIRNKAGYWISRGCVTSTKMVFQVTNGAMHIVTVFSEGDEIRVTDNGINLNVVTTEDLRGHILSIVEVE